MLRLRDGLRSFSSEFIICSVGLLALAAPAAGQATQAAIMGVVADSSGAILPGVTVTATGPALQVPRVDTVTNERGEYRLSPLPIGTYNVTYELPGFQTVRREGVRLSVGFVATLDQVMSLGTVSETVTVSGASQNIAFAGPDKKTLYIVGRGAAFKVQMLSQGFSGRAK